MSLRKIVLATPDGERGARSQQSQSLTITTLRCAPLARSKLNAMTNIQLILSKYLMPFLAVK